MTTAKHRNGNLSDLHIITGRTGGCNHRINYNQLGTLLVVLLATEWNSIRLGGASHGIMTKTVHKTLPGVGGIGSGSNIRTEVKPLKIDIAERTRTCESLLLKITYLNIFVENHKK